MAPTLDARERPSFGDWLRSNIIALVLAIGAAIGVWVTMDRRVTILETKQTSQESVLVEIKKSLDEQRNLLIGILQKG